MSKCNHCETTVSFMSVLNTLNPFKIKCSSCKEPILIDKVSSGIALFIISAIVIIALILLHDGSDNYMLQTVLPVAAAAEVAYFALIKFGIVKIKST